MFNNISFLYKMTIKNIKLLFRKRQKCLNQSLKNNSVVWLGHATVLINLNGTIIITDPVLAKYLGYIKRLVDVPLDISSIHIDYIILSHGHTDHIHFPTLNKINKDAIVIAPKPYKLPIELLRFKDIKILKPGDIYDDGRLYIKAIRASHDGRRFYLGKNSASNSYLIISGNKSVFYAGDTAYTNEFDNISCDVSLMPVGCYLPESFSAMHCSPLESYKMFCNMNSSTMIPIHFKTYIISLDNDSITEQTLKSLNDPRIKILDIGERFNF